MATNNSSQPASTTGAVCLHAPAPPHPTPQSEEEEDEEKAGSEDETDEEDDEYSDEEEDDEVRPAAVPSPSSVIGQAFSSLLSRVAAAGGRRGRRRAGRFRRQRTGADRDLAQRGPRRAPTGHYGLPTHRPLLLHPTAELLLVPWCARRPGHAARPQATASRLRALPRPPHHTHTHTHPATPRTRAWRPQEEQRDSSATAPSTT